jgi:hypothetical protein
MEREQGNTTTPEATTTSAPVEMCVGAVRMQKVFKSNEFEESRICLEMLIDDILLDLCFEVKILLSDLDFYLLGSLESEDWTL